ncbi:hypothetical protein [Patulibacter minatonensis]|uniref:hypothetical protein n=1 Tax=Patulibacter minatonensis TaxID=298163 RepID=UPI00047E8A6C|nr:hypothetical protein [Patulibacter minatonensis]
MSGPDVDLPELRLALMRAADERATARGRGAAPGRDVDRRPVPPPTVLKAPRATPDPVLPFPAAGRAPALRGRLAAVACAAVLAVVVVFAFTSTGSSGAPGASDVADGSARRAATMGPAEARAGSPESDARSSGVTAAGAASTGAAGDGTSLDLARVLRCSVGSAFLVPPRDAGPAVDPGDPRAC